MPWSLPVLFALTALLYASVGFGGGSTYNALLVLTGTDYRILPAIALTCNMIVVSGGVWRFARAGHLPARRLMPFLLASIPAAWAGGRLAVPEIVFVGLLGAALLLSGLHMLRPEPAKSEDPVPDRTVHWPLSLLTGGSIGLVAGLTGIGGGIFLAPVLYVMGWGTPREIAGAASLFILVNSLSGLTGQLTKLSELALLELAQPYWPLLPAVLIGGQIGTWLGARGLAPPRIRQLTALLILYVAARLLWRFFGMV